jgi:hypothetical protein
MITALSSRSSLGTIRDREMETGEVAPVLHDEMMARLRR